MDIVTKKGLNKPQRTQDELRRDLEVANGKLLDLKRRKKIALADFNDMIKDQETEIESIVGQLKILEDKNGNKE